MHFDLKTPCRECPFRSDVKPYLTTERAQDIVDTVVLGGRTFTCHKTINGEFDGYDYHAAVDDQMCAGAMAMIEAVGAPHQMLQIAERLGIRDPENLKPRAPTYTSVEAMIEAYRDANA